jgi:NADPH:quinone reductase-like Zn-dependent oxidoreductase
MCCPEPFWLLRFGLEEKFDYNSTDFVAGSDRYDVFDAVGKSSFVNCRQLLAPGGTYVTTLPMPSLFFWSAVQSIAGIFSKETRKGNSGSTEREGSCLSLSVG